MIGITIETSRASAFPGRWVARTAVPLESVRMRYEYLHRSGQKASIVAYGFTRSHAENRAARKAKKMLERDWRERHKELDRAESVRTKTIDV